MSVTIRYCKTCGFDRPAREIAQTLEAELGIDVDLQEAFWGAFLIECDGRVIYNRWKTRGLLGRLGFGRTPTPEEIVSRFRGDRAQRADCSAGRRAVER